MGVTFYRDIAIYSIVLLILIQLIRGKFDLLDAIVFALPFKYAYLDIGFAVSLTQALLTLFMGMFFIKNLLVSPNKIHWNKNILLFVLYSCVVTIGITHVSGMEFIKVIRGNFFREEGRYILQIFVFIYFYFQIIAISNFIKTKKKIVELLRVYISAVFILAVLGIVQLVVFTKTGIDIFPLGDEFAGYRTGGFQGFGQMIVRVSSLGGEPKGTGVTLVVGFTLLLLMKNFKLYQFRFYNLFTGLILVICILTFSTSAYVVLIAMLIIYLALLIWKGEFKIKANLKNGLLFLGFIFFVVAAYEPIKTVFELRITKQLDDSDGGSEGADTAIADFLSDNPSWLYFGSGLGNIHNLAYPYIPENHKYYMDDTVFVARAGLLVLISELGIFGFLLFVFVIFRYAYRINRFYKRDPLAKVLFAALIITTVFYMVRGGYVSNEFILIVSLTASYLMIQKKNAKAIDTNKLIKI